MGDSPQGRMIFIFLCIVLTIIVLQALVRIFLFSYSKQLDEVTKKKRIQRMDRLTTTAILLALIALEIFLLHTPWFPVKRDFWLAAILALVIGFLCWVVTNDFKRREKEKKGISFFDRLPGFSFALGIIALGLFIGGCTIYVSNHPGLSPIIAPHP